MDIERAEDDSLAINCDYDERIAESDMVNRLKEFVKDGNNSHGAMNETNWSKPKTINRIRALVCCILSIMCSVGRVVFKVY